MRHVSEGQSYLDFTNETSRKGIEEYREKYEWISEVLDANEFLLW